MPHVLIIEDEVIVALDYAQLLKRARFDVEMVATVEAALDHLRASRPDVVVLDGNLRTRSTVKVAQELDNQRIPYVMCSAYPATAFAAWANPVLFIRKPCQAETLIAAVRHAVDCNP